MAKYLAGKLVRLGNSHFQPGEELPEKVMLTGQTEPTPLEKVGNFNECIKDGTFKLASEAEAPAAKPAAKPK